MVAILAHIQNEVTAFEPDAIAAMSQAFEESCAALQIFAGDERGREAVATHILDLARSGVINPVALRERVLLESRASA